MSLVAEAPDFAAAIAEPRSLADPPLVAEVRLTALLAAAVRLGTVRSNGVDALLVVPESVSVAVKAYDPAARSAVLKLQAPVLLAVVVPNADEPPSDTVTVAPAAAVPVSLTASYRFTVPLVIVGTATVGAATVTSSAADFALVVPESVSVAVNAYDPAARSAVVKLQAPELFAVVVPNGAEPPSDTVTVALATPVPVSVTELFELTEPLLIFGAATVGAATVTSRRRRLRARRA